MPEKHTHFLKFSLDVPNLKNQNSFVNEIFTQNGPYQDLAVLMAILVQIVKEE